MEIQFVTPNEYLQFFPRPISLFNSVEFSELNSYKCIHLHYLIFKDKKVRLGIIIGEKKDSFNVPFSASYGGFSYNSNVAFQYYEAAAVLLVDWVKKNGKKLRIILAPSIYNSIDSAKTLGAFTQAGARIDTIEYNQHFELRKFCNYMELIDSKTRNKLRNALNEGLLFHILNSKSEFDIARVYDIIRCNHEEKGRPLHMSLQNIIDTVKIIPADIFVVSNLSGSDVAAALIFHTTDIIYQVVYWGDIPMYANLKSMNYLSYKIFEFYNSKGIEILDIGISTECGIPNYGLCEFKENIGCDASSRFTLIVE